MLRLFWARPRCLGLESCGKLARLTNDVSSSGLFSWTGAGRRRGCIGMAFAPTKTAFSAASRSETMDHMVLQCAISWDVRFKSLRRCQWQDLAPGPDSCFVPWWTSVCKRVDCPQCKAFDSLVLAVAWGIWSQRNDKVFRAASLPSVLGCWCHLVCYGAMVSRCLGR
jgi:hypothetical protein